MYAKNFRRNLGFCGLTITPSAHYGSCVSSSFSVAIFLVSESYALAPNFKRVLTNNSDSQHSCPPLTLERLLLRVLLIGIMLEAGLRKIFFIV